MDKVITYVSGEFRIYFPYNSALVSAVRDLPKRTFRKEGRNGYWVADDVVANIPALANFAAAHQFAVDDVAAAQIQALAERKPVEEAQEEALRRAKEVALAKIPQITAEQLNGEITRFTIDTRAYNYEQSCLIKSAGNAKWDGQAKRWSIPFSRSAVAVIEGLVAEYGLTIEPGLAEKINEQVATLDNFITMSGLHDSDLSIPVPAGLAYLGYQKAGIAYAAQKGNVLIGDEPGLGKTIQSIGISNMTPAVRRILVIAPASLKMNWKREWEKWDIKGLKVGIVNGGKASNWPADVDVVIINFDLVSKHLERLHAEPWDMMVVDEAHKLRNPKAKRTSHILGRKNGQGTFDVEPIPAKRLVLMTGTPIVNRPIELWPLINAVNPIRFNDFFAYAKRYCGATNNGYGWNFNGATNLDELQSELRAHCMVRRTKAEVLQELPAKTRQIIRLENHALADAERKGMAAIRDRLANLEATKILAFLKDDLSSYEDAVVQLKEASKAVFREMSQLRHRLALAKVPYVVELVKDALEQGKVILFAHHSDVIAAYKEVFGNAAVVVDGGTPNERRQEAADRFQNDPTCTVFIGSIQSAGVGFTLTASAHVIFGELDWVPGNMSQAEDRAHRIGQKDNVLVWHVVIDGTIDARMAEILLQKQDIIDGAMDDEIHVEGVFVDGNAPVAVEEVEEVISDQLSEISLPAFQVIGHEEVTAWIADAKVRAKANSLKVAANRATERAASRGFGTEAAAMSEREIAAVHANLNKLADVCDGAMEKDGMGFNGTDAKVGHALAMQIKLEPLQAAYARAMLRKYAKQLGSAAIDAMYDSQRNAA